MGVKGLWPILEPTARPVPLDSLRGQRVAVDASIWLFQFSKISASLPSTSASPNFALSGLLRRLIKLAYFGIQPVLVFDGAAPQLKKNTINERQAKRAEDETRYKRLALKILRTKMKLTALRTAEGNSGEATIAAEENSQSVRDAVDAGFDAVDSSDDYEEGYALEDYLATHKPDVNSREFLSLPADIQEEIVLSLRRARPDFFDTGSDESSALPAADFSVAQIKALMKRQGWTRLLEKTRSIGDSSLFPDKNATAKRIASDTAKEFVLVKNAGVGYSLQYGDADPDSTSDAKMRNEKELPIDESPRHLPHSSDDESQVFERLFSSRGSEGLETREKATNPVDYESGWRHDTERTNKLASPKLQSLDNDQRQGHRKMSLSTSATKLQDSTPATWAASSTRTVSKPVLAFLGESSGLDLGSEESLQEPALQSDILEGHQSNVVVHSSDPCDAKMVEDSVEELNSGHQSSATTEADCVALSLSDGDETLSDLGSVEALIKEVHHAESDTAAIAAALRLELESLNSSLPKLASASIAPTGDLLDEFKMLLKLFGIPFVNAPFEAEAQCAWLASNKLVDAVITDDSDIFLFSSADIKIFRHFFQDKKVVQCFRILDIKRELGFDRESLIALAYLLGSDYTVGVRGIGAKKAVAIVKYLQDVANQQSTNIALDILELFAAGVHKGTWPGKLGEAAIKVLRQWTHTISISNTFPDERIYNGYTRPNIEQDATGFSWSLPDWQAIENWIRHRLHWSDDEISSTLKPVIKMELDHHAKKIEAQKTLDSFVVHQQSPATHPRTKRQVAAKTKPTKRHRR